MITNNKLYKVWETIITPNITDERWIEWIIWIEFYKQRMLSILEQEDYAIMPKVTQKYNKILYELLTEINIPIIKPDNIIYVEYNWNLSSSILNDVEKIKLPKKIKYLLPFIHSGKIDSIAKKFNLNTSRNTITSEIINNKWIAQNELRKLWVTTPDWEVVYTKKQAIKIFEKLKKKWYEYVTIKLTRSASWMWVYKIKDLYELEKKLSGHKKDLKNWILIDGWIKWKFITSPNIQYYVWKRTSEDVFIWCSSQILSKDWTVHLWNISNIEILKNKKLQEDIKIILNWVRSQKAYWIIWIDFVIFEDPETKGQKAYFMEINWRINWSTHWPIIAGKTNWNTIDNWAVMNNIYLPDNMTVNDFISLLERNRLYYDPSKKQWVIPTNISAIDEHHKAMVAIIWDKKKYIKEVIEEINKI